ncbi:hypothetical protein [Falsihalocynthiibacter arcticus]|uniref:ParB/Sulfiredoxin domain-containing protein n=1 Tax=Falsihalocynthiibacter arcticus TaxID=1579316 RepID=A0A126V7V8_9RHOB|nr:hypothetical protein [Falsihalocynthiibacter arcticus]AML53809.1 hypothetical protein RC74_21385 [Falsihalocynthiibacter arcticus]
MAKRILSVKVDQSEVVSVDTIKTNPFKSGAMPEMSGIVKGVAAGDQAQTILELREKLLASEKNPQAEKSRVVDDILAGRLAISIHPDWLIDQVGSDRDNPLGSSGTAESDFARLADDIDLNGQMQPIRVRVSADTSDIREALYILAAQTAEGSTNTSQKPPGELVDRLFLQSGRRRTAACRQKNKRVMAFVSADTTEGSSEEATDLLERFRENELRSDLSGWEKLKSIAQIKNAMPELSQQDLSNKLGIGRGDISVAVSAVELENELEGFYGAKFRENGIRWFRQSIPTVKVWVKDGRPEEGVSTDTLEKPASIKKKVDKDFHVFEPHTLKARRRGNKIELSSGYTLSLGADGVTFSVTNASTGEFASKEGVADLMKILTSALKNSKIQVD